VKRTVLARGLGAGELLCGDAAAGAVASVTQPWRAGLTPATPPVLRRVVVVGSVTQPWRAGLTSAAPPVLRRVVVVVLAHPALARWANLCRAGGLG